VRPPDAVSIALLYAKCMCSHAMSCTALGGVDSRNNGEKAQKGFSPMLYPKSMDCKDPCKTVVAKSGLVVACYRHDDSVRAQSDYSFRVETQW
jgi:hypothetical protein